MLASVVHRTRLGPKVDRRHVRSSTASLLHVLLCLMYATAWGQPKASGPAVNPAGHENATDALPKPTEAEQAEAEKLVRAAFKPDFQKRLADRRDLPAKLVREADSNSDSPAMRYVLYRDAVNVAAPIGDYADARTALDAMAHTWPVEAEPMRAQALTTALRAATPGRHSRNCERGDGPHR